MSNKIITFAAVKTFYDSGKDIYGVFANLILSLISENKSYKLVEITELIERECNLKLPEDVVRTISKRLKRDGIVQYSELKKGNISITDLGCSLKIKNEQEYKTAEREISALIRRIQEFIEKKHSQNYECETLRGRFEQFLEKNSFNSTELLEKRIPINNRDGCDVLDSFFYDFIEEVEKSDQQNLDRIKVVLFGRVLVKAILDRTIDIKAKIENLVVYFDTNIIFSVLGLHNEVFNRPAKEIFEELKLYDVTMKISEFTRDEIISTLNFYGSVEGNYVSNIKVNSIYNELQKKGFRNTDVILLIEKLDTHLDEMGISIDWEIPELNVNPEDVGKLLTFKPHGTYNAAFHDIQAINLIRFLRKKNHKTGSMLLEKVGFVFLTADNGLKNFLKVEMNGKKDRSFPELLIRDELASILWLKRMETYKGNYFVDSMLANYMTREFISNSLWNTFLRRIEEFKRRGEFSEQDMTMIITRSETELILKEFGEEGIEKILNAEYIKAGLKERALLIEEKEKAIIIAKERTKEAEAEVLAKRELELQMEENLKIISEKDQAIELKQKEAEAAALAQKLLEQQHAENLEIISQQDQEIEQFKQKDAFEKEKQLEKSRKRCRLFRVTLIIAPLVVFICLLGYVVGVYAPSDTINIFEYEVSYIKFVLIFFLSQYTLTLVSGWGFLNKKQLDFIPGLLDPYKVRNFILMRCAKKCEEKFKG